MTLILSGTDGLSDIDGSAATPAIRGTDANTGIFFPAADTVAISTGGVERVRVTSAGYLTQTNQPMFDVYGTGSQSWSGAANTQTVAFNTKTGNIPAARSTNFNTSTYTFTAPVTAAYFFYFGITITGAATGPEAYLYVNSSTYRMGVIAYMYSGGYFTGTGSQIVYLNANDTANIRVTNNNSTSFTIDLGRSYFGGYMLS